MTNWPRGGYPAGNVPASELKPPPPGMVSKQTVPAAVPYPPVEIRPLPPYDEARQRVAMELTILDPARNYIVVLAEDAMSLLNGPTEPTLTASEVKVLTETAGEAGRRIGWKAAGEEIAAALTIRYAENLELAQGDLDILPTDGRTGMATGFQRAASIALRIASQPSGATSDATSGVPGHPEVSEAVRSPQEPCEAPDCPIPLMHTHPWLNAPGPHHPVGIRSTDVGPFVQCSCGDNPTPKYWIEHHWPGDRTEGERLVRSLIRDTKEDPS